MGSIGCEEMRVEHHCDSYGSQAVQLLVAHHLHQHSLSVRAFFRPFATRCIVCNQVR